MRIAVTYDHGNVGQHFGETEAFKIYEITGGKVTGTEMVSTNGKGHRELIPVVKGLNADVVICGGVGTPMKNAIEEAGMMLYMGITGSADAAVAKLLAGILQSDTSAEHSCHH